MSEKVIVRVYQPEAYAYAVVDAGAWDDAVRYDHVAELLDPVASDLESSYDYEVVDEQPWSLG